MGAWSFDVTGAYVKVTIFLRQNPGTYSVQWRGHASFAPPVQIVDGGGRLVTLMSKSSKSVAIWTR